MVTEKDYLEALDRQHPLLERLNPLAVCTIRVISLLMDCEVSIEETVIRTLS